MSTQRSRQQLMQALRWLCLAVLLGIPLLFILMPLATFLLYGFWHVENGDSIGVPIAKGHDTGICTIQRTHWYQSDTTGR